MGAAKWIRFAVLALFASLFFWLFYIRYWKYRDCIAASKSSCVTSEGDNLISAGAFWIIPAIVFVFFALWTVRRRKATR